MAQTLYVTFEDLNHAEKAVGALLDYGARKEDITIVTDHAGQNYDSERATGTIMRNYPDGTQAIDPIGAAYSDSTATYASAPLAYNTLPPNSVVSTGARTAVIEDVRKHAESDITTTTGGDAASGAAKGAGIGLGVGILAGLAALTIPGVGFVLGGGALAAAIAAAAATTAAGVVAGGVTGYLKDQGLPAEAVETYQGRLQTGGSLVAITLPSGSVDEATGQEIVSKYGGADVNVY